MAVRRRNPLGIEALDSVPESVLTPDALNTLVSRIKDADQALQPWLAKQKKLSQLRYGDLPKRVIPWPGAANIPFPLIDGMIRRFRPGISSLILDADPIATLTPESPDDYDSVRPAEDYLTTLFTQRMTTSHEAARLTDLFAHRGHAYSREGWDYQTRVRVRVCPVDDIIPEGMDNFQNALAQQQLEPVPVLVERLQQQFDLEGPEEMQVAEVAAQRILAGASHVRLKYKEDIRNLPGWMAVDPVSVAVPIDQDPEQADFFCFFHDLTVHTIAQRAADGMFEPAAVEKLTRDRQPRRDVADVLEGPQDTLRQDILEFLNRKSSNGTPTGASDTIRVWEVFAKLDLDGDGIVERYVLWIVPGADNDKDSSHIVLRSHEYVHPFERWPVTLYKFSADAVRPTDSRGMSEMLASFARIANEFQNARLNASQILLSPVFKRRVTAAHSPELKIDWRPGGSIDVHNMDDIEPMVHDLRTLAEIIREEQVNQRAAETYMGVFDATLTSLENSRERRTATEVQTISNVSASIFGLDARLFQDSFSRSLTKIWELYLEWGDAEDFVRRTGEDPVVVRKADIGKKFDIYANGTPSNTNRAILLNTAERVLQTVVSLAGVIDPGLVDISALLKHWMRLLDNRLASRMIRSPQQAESFSVIQRAAAEAGELTGGAAEQPKLL